MPRSYATAAMSRSRWPWLRGHLERYGAGGQVIESRVINRTATFAFFIDDRFFGVITAYVHGPEAAGYRFTSALPAQLLKTLAPALLPLLEPSRVRTARASTGSVL